MEGQVWVVKMHDVKLVIYVPWTCIFTSNRGRINKTVQRVSCSFRELPAGSGYCLPWTFSKSKSLWGRASIFLAAHFAVPLSPSNLSFQITMIQMHLFFFSSCLSPPPPPRLFMIHRAFVKDSNINVGLRCHQVPPGYLLLLLLFCSLYLKYYFLISTDKWPSSDWLKSLNSSMHWGCSKVLRFGNFFYWT